MKIPGITACLLILAACAQNGATADADLEASCEALVAAETGVRPDGVNAISTQTVPTGSITTVSVEGAVAPWLCRSDAGGVVTSVEYSQEG